MDFSLLMSVYEKDRPRHFDEAIQSVVEQEVRPTKYVIVKDGELTKEMEECLLKWRGKIGSKMKIITLPVNMGLANALNVGLRECTYEYIARMDSDDVCYPNRFKLQFDYLATHPEISMLGGWYKQYNENMTRYITNRRPPTKHDDIVKYGRQRTPFNHVTAVFRTKDVLKVGGYPNDICRLEDWWLVLRLIKNGYRLHNLPEYLVKVRGGDNFMMRRGGVSHIYFEVKGLYAMRKEGLMSSMDLIINSVIRMLVRLLPLPLTKMLYKLIRKLGTK